MRAVEPLIAILTSRAAPGVTDTPDNVVPIVVALEAVLKRHQSHVDESALRRIVELGDIWIGVTSMEYDEPTRYVKFDYSHVQQLAREELLRRGEEGQSDTHA